jgi:hypothetical protein
MTEHSKTAQDGKVVRQHCIGEKEKNVSVRQPSILRYSYVDGIHSSKERKVRFAAEPAVADDDPPAQDQAERSPSADASARESSTNPHSPQYFYHKHYYHDNNVPPEPGHGEYAAYEPHAHQGVQQPGYYAYPYAYPYACWMPQQHFSAQNHDVPTPMVFATHPETMAINGQTHDQISSTSRDTSMMQLKAKSVCITVNTAEEDHCKATKIPSSTAIPSYWPEKNGEGLTKEELCLEETQLAGFGRRRLRRSCMLRIFNEWRKLCDQRWWKSQILLREQQNALLIGQINHMEHRPVRYLYRNRVRAWLRWWLANSKRKTLQKQAIEVAHVRYTVSLISRVWSKWLELVLDAQAEAVQSNRAANISDNRRRRAVFKSWRIQVGTRDYKRRAVEGAIAYRRRYLLHRALGSWFYLTKVETIGKAVASRHGKWLQIVVFKAWRSWVAYKGSIMTLVRATRGKRDWSLLQQTLYSWLASVDAKRYYRMRVACARLQAENQRLMIENDRLKKICG